LERHLWTIAREVEAAGMSAGLRSVLDPARIPGLDQLSPRQWDILTRLLQNQRVPGIAQDLHLSQSTVRNYLTEIFARVGVHSQAQLLALVQNPQQRSTTTP
jgi:DNA-binding NarL/FixJ family response regulator